jgi:hypothetical protein
MLDDAAPPTYQGRTFASHEAMALYLASRAPAPGTAAHAKPSVMVWAVCAGMAALLLSTCQLGSRTTPSTTSLQSTSDFAQQYATAWQSGPHQGIMQALANHHATGCGEFYYRAATHSSTEFLVHCTADGTHWTAYLVWPAIGKVIGPNKPSTSLPPPR